MTVNELTEQVKKMPSDATVDIQTKAKRSGPAGHVIFFKVDSIKPYDRRTDRLCIGITETNRF